MHVMRHKELRQYIGAYMPTGMSDCILFAILVHALVTNVHAFKMVLFAFIADKYCK